MNFVKVIESDNVVEFEAGINYINENNNVFATQTHTSNVNGKLIYSAVCFIRGA